MGNPQESRFNSVGMQRVMKIEIWKPVLVDEYNGLYEVSNLGRVRSLDRVFIRSNGKPQPVTGRVLKQTKDKYGYMKVILSNQGHERNFFVHRLVALSFLENEQKLPQVNHKNSIRNDNDVKNLEWVTEQENVIHGFEYGEGKKGMDHRNSKQLYLFKNGDLLTVFESLTKCSEVLQLPRKTIRQYIKNGKMLFEEIEIKVIENGHYEPAKLNHNPFKRTIENLKRRPVCLTNKTGEILAIYETREMAESQNEIPNECLMYPKQKHSLYKNTYYVKDCSQYDYLIADESLVNKKIIQTIKPKSSTTR